MAMLASIKGDTPVSRWTPASLSLTRKAETSMQGTIGSLHRHSYPRTASSSQGNPIGSKDAGIASDLAYVGTQFDTPAK
ncbi:hypothetical protein Slin15195_G039470 [Septoria linicola]|uniref:Uncharacterized protein n=1 Tax=Septoria linicola TaxID=215465 RepID=A0A9Q9EIR9_9PEZI|nr:hypothetical protein Slin14017_G120890 [Septoria linicola]USW50628.1 hypothetical protein Slin15195_G039470 [Septoria linicola]